MHTDIDTYLDSYIHTHIPRYTHTPTHWLTCVCFPAKLEEVVSLEMEHHLLDKEDGCDDSTDAAFSDDEEEVNTRGNP